MRRLALIPKQHNAKGIGLFLQGYCNLYKAVQKDHKLVELFGSAQDIVIQIRELADLLIEMRSAGDYHGACWGYNFDWQARLKIPYPASI